MSAERVHGGPDAQGAAAIDLSTCSHPAGPNALALRRVRAADPGRYPDPGYAALRERLAALHEVESSRLLIAASASEFIQRVTAVSARLAPGAVRLPALAYGDYAAAALAWGRELTTQGPATLRWLADPGSPLGQSEPAPADLAQLPSVLDAAYAPLRLQGEGWTRAQRDAVFQLYTPNKALGLCGVRAAYAIAPLQPPAGWVQALRAAEPSWAIGAQGQALLEAWCEPDVRQLLAESLAGLLAWRAALADGLLARGFAPLSGAAPFVCARLPAGSRLQAGALRRHGLAVRDCASFGLPAHWRINAAPPEALAALWAAIDTENP